MNSGSAMAQSKPGPWRPMLSATSADMWRGYKMTTMPPGWSVVGGVLSKTKTTEDIITKEEFTDFRVRNGVETGKGGQFRIVLSRQ